MPFKLFSSAWRWLGRRRLPFVLRHSRVSKLRPPQRSSTGFRRGRDCC
jgi:hypothetical protein